MIAFTQVLAGWLAINEQRDVMPVALPFFDVEIDADMSCDRRDVDRAIC